MPNIKEKFCILKILEGTPLELASVRSLLKDQAHIEIENTFIASINRTFKRTITTFLNQEEIKYLLIYVDDKTGCDVRVNGMLDADRKSLEDIVLDVTE